LSEQGYPGKTIKHKSEIGGIMKVVIYSLGLSRLNLSSGKDATQKKNFIWMKSS
jgi:hypothetical protein